VANSSTDGSMGCSEESEAVAVSVIVPCHNEEDCIHEFHRRMRGVLEEMRTPYEMIFVNDGSWDQTEKLLIEMQRLDRNVVILDLSRNHGHQLALSAGLSVAQGQRVLLIDADLQDPPELLPEMMAAMDAGADVAYAQRISRAGESRFKRWTAKIFYRLLRALSHADMPVDTGDFRLISSQVAGILRQMPEPHRFLRGMVAWVGFRQVAVTYRRDSRYGGKTKYDIGSMVGLAIDAVTGFASAPLRFMFYLSAAASVAAAGFLGWTIYAFLYLPVVPGWASIMCVQLAFSAINLFALGLIGEYVGRSYIQGKGRPPFIIRSVSRATGDGEPMPHDSSRGAVENKEELRCG
jgi:glycosyltransferase involved in cell wall biosynthesis